MFTLRHGPYVARVTYDEVDESFHGVVANLRDTVHFTARSVDDLKRAFAESVEDYIAFCKEQGEQPEKPYSGKYPLRLSPELHRKADLTAATRNLSLNAYIAQLIDKDTADID